MCAVDKEFLIGQAGVKTVVSIQDPKFERRVEDTYFLFYCPNTEMQKQPIRCFAYLECAQVFLWMMPWDEDSAKQQLYLLAEKT